MIREILTVCRNDLIREFSYSDGVICDISTGERRSGSFLDFSILKNDLRKCGFKVLPFNPLNVVMNDLQKERFTKIYGFCF